MLKSITERKYAYPQWCGFISGYFRSFMIIFLTVELIPSAPTNTLALNISPLESSTSTYFSDDFASITSRLVWT